MKVDIMKIVMSSLQVFFEAEEIEEWEDPFDSITLKILTIIVYTLEICALVVMMIFVGFETCGYAGHYRTVINQLLSTGYGAVSICFEKFRNQSHDRGYELVQHM